MPKFQDIKKVLIIGSGPIVIGQACEFDYSGTQACKALMNEGLEVILVNSNPATIMTDPDLASKVYIEPLSVEYLEKILEIEKPDAIIPTLGGQTALNLALDLHHKDILKKHNVRLLGATPEVIKAAEDRELFRDLLQKAGAKATRSEMVKNLDQGLRLGDKFGYPLILRPNYTLGGGGGGIAYSLEEYQLMLAKALKESPTSEVLVEESILGWKEFELEIMRDAAGTFVIICSIENFDPCGVHTGDSITVAPQQTLSDRAYQDMRDEAKKIVEAVGLECGGANIQFAVNPLNGERIVIEMNPRVSRSSALASKATGFPIAKIAALLAVGYRLDEISNDITKTTPSCYEPALDYVVTKIPRFAFEKFPGSKDSLTTQMKSVGEVMAIGRTFKESLQKALLSLESSKEAFKPVHFSVDKLTEPNSQRIYHIAQAFRHKLKIEEIFRYTQITPWFLEQIHEIIEFENELSGSEIEPHQLLKAKRLGFSDFTIARLTRKTPEQIYEMRESTNLFPGFSQIDTCAGEFFSKTPYFYSSYWYDSKISQARQQKDKIVVLGSGPNRIGQGIEFDYSCVRGVKSLQREGYKVVMINSNPETVSTDYDTSDELYFEPLTSECVIEVLRRVNPFGVVTQLGGQTPINIASELVQKKYHLLGSNLESIDLAEDREKFSKVCRELDFKIPSSGMAAHYSEALEISKRVGFPMICRPSYVLGGRRMEVVESEDELKSYFQRHQEAINSDRPCLMDEFLAGALEVDVDLIRGQDWIVIGGIVEHIEAAGVHSGDSMGVLPPQRLKPDTCLKIETLSCQLADRLQTIGHLNLQLAIKNGQIYMLEANPRSSRSVPFISKATSIPIVDLGAKAMLGYDKSKVSPEKYHWDAGSKVHVKGVVFPFKKFQDADSILGPEMKSTGESMGRGSSYAEALLKAAQSSQIILPQKGEIFLSLRDKDKPALLKVIKSLKQQGFSFSGTHGTAQFLNENGIDCISVKKVHEGRPNCVDRIRSGVVALVFNTASGRWATEASFDIRRSCIDYSIPCLTESHAIEALHLAIEQLKDHQFGVSALDKMIM